MDIQQRIKIIEELIEDFKLDVAEKQLTTHLKSESNSLEMLLLLGKIKTKQQQYGDALNIYNNILEEDNNNEKAKTAINMINNILKIRRSFYFENTYTDDDLYL
jgi:lipopolysaccharide biosynthesis regulator YciM